MKRFVIGVAAGAVVLALHPAAARAPRPTIAFVNPSGYEEGGTLANSPDSDATYHLVAWSGGTPRDAVVEFELEAPGRNASTFLASDAGDGTWELGLDLDGFVDGPHTLRARLYAGPCPGPSCREVATSEMPVTVRKATELPLPSPQSVEIFASAPADDFGLWPRRGADVALIRGRASEETSSVSGFYSTSDPGTAPDWTQCGTALPLDTGGVQVLCELDAKDGWREVTAIGLLAHGLLGSVGVPTEDSGDAHPVDPYKQNATSISVTASRASSKLRSCNIVTVMVRDQLDNPVAGANLDVHASGPDDQLRFGSVTDTTSAFVAPNRAHGEPEHAWGCTEGDSKGQQADHNVPGASDRKHIESTTGTDLNAQFRFAVRAEGVGTTTLKVWADARENDRMNKWEGRGYTSIVWVK